jgi:uncharacterized membrane protein YfcA
MIQQFVELSPDFDIHWYQWALAMLAAFVLGIAKAGIKGLGVLIVTIMALVFGGKVSTGIIVPLLVVADILAVIYYRRNADWKLLFKLLPWMLIGVLLGVYVGQDLPETIFKRGMAIIILITTVLMFWWEQRKVVKVPKNRGFAGIMGLSAGFTTMIGNLAGAFANIFFLAMRVPKNVFIGTTAWLFFIINLFKLPFHIWSWETVNVETFAVNIRLIPIVVLGFVVGVKTVALIKEGDYRRMILILTAIGAVMIFLS